MQNLPIIGGIGLALVLAWRSVTIRAARNRSRGRAVDPASINAGPPPSFEPTSRAFRPGTPV